MKKLLVLFICFLILLPLAACGSPEEIESTIAADDRTVPEERQYVYWLRVAEKFYTGYDINPGIEYLETLSFGEDENGNPKYIDLSFYIPVTGSESDNFNTLIATGEYLDVMDLTAYTGTARDLYEEGVAMDITEWVESTMPNYMAFLDANPDLKATATDIVDGEPRYLRIHSYDDAVGSMWGGYEYRRDWIIKYGTHPIDGSTFSGEYKEFNADGTPNLDSWEDNVVFPSGGSDPVYISDWEWMFPIFDLALDDLGITDGYGISLYYPGFLQMGDLVCAFGGGGPVWYLNPDNQIVFGGTSDGFRTYLQAMNTWYANGWLDKAFAEHSTDNFYTYDKTKIFTGKVGVWWGGQYSLGGRWDNPEDPLLNGIVVSTAAQPINDIYGSESEQNVIPYTMYQTTRESAVSFMVTTAAQDKDLETLFTFMDFMFGHEGAVLRTFGLSQEQYEVTKSAYLTENGFTAGTYEIVEEEGVTRYKTTQAVLDSGLDSGIKPMRLPGLGLNSLTSKSTHHPGFLRNLDRWTQYINTGSLSTSFTNQLSAENAKIYNKTQTNINEFMTKYVPNFIKGTSDPFSDEDWNAFVKALNKYDPDTVTVMLQELADQLYGQ